MARKTYLELRTYGAAIAGNDAVDDWVKTKMNAWFRKHYAAYAWPFLISQAASVTLSAGDTSIEVGGGSSGLTRQITRIFSPIYFRASGSFTNRGQAPVRQIVGDPSEMAAGFVDSSSQVGRPQSFIALPFQSSGSEKITLIPFPVPDKAYILGFTYQKLPDDMADTDIPIYPNEMTLIQACKVAAIEYDSSNSQFYIQEAQILSDMVAADRDTYGGTQSFGDILQLDSSVFK